MEGQRRLAEGVRTGLNMNTQHVDNKQLRTFGTGFCVILSVFAGISYWKGSRIAPWVLLSFGAMFGSLGLIAPKALERIYHPWMKFAEKLAWVNTRLLLGIVFFLVMTPIGLLMRIAGKDPMERKFSGSTYWKSPKAHSMGNKHFERQS